MKYIGYLFHQFKALQRIKYNGLLSGSYKEIFVEGAYKWLFDILKPNTILMDIGTNMCDIAIYFAVSQKVRKVIASEANPETAILAQKLIVKVIKVNVRR